MLAMPRGGGHLLIGVCHILADLISENLTDTLQIPTETHAVHLHIGAAHLGDELVEEGILGSQNV
jgi:hypothetical protein